MKREEQLAGVLLGMAVGDAVGLPREGLTRRRAARLFGGAPIEHRLLPGHGMVSDDTEHACLTGQAMLATRERAAGVDRGGGDFARALAWRLRGWLLCLPAGVGWATLRACIRLWLGFPAGRSGVVSAGNGPAMRAPLLGACLATDAERREAWVRASTRLTHRHPLAEEGALLVAEAAALACLHAPGERSPGALLAALREGSRARGAPSEWDAALEALEAPLARGASVAAVADALGLAEGVTGFILHTVPVALYAWLRHPADARSAVEAVVLCGGDTDTTGAITGALVGAGVGAAGLPARWISGLWEWPRGEAWMRRLAARLALRFPLVGTPQEVRPMPLAWPLLALRGLLFTCVVLAHGLRRVLPPY